jgi:glutamine amidotransferase
VIGVVDYGAGNLGSVMNAFERLRLPARFASGPEELAAAPGSSPFDRIVFPGDGHFATAMASLEKSGYAAALKDWIRADKPFLGICIGMQLLFESSEEAPGVSGLGVLPGAVRRFPGRKVPQIGWNSTIARPDSQLFAGIPQGSFFYYIHSYYCAPAVDADAAAETEYYVKYCSAAERGNLRATQFHPEKSGTVGLELLKNWATGK